MTNQINDKQVSCEKCSLTSIIFTYINAFLTLAAVVYAIYLSIKVNSGFNFGSFLLALFFAPFYILYHLAVKS